VIQPSKKALLKLNAIVQKKIGYPDKWKDYSSVEISKDDLIQKFEEHGALYIQVQCQ
jgi:predicted metalloendopeptidase